MFAKFGYSRKKMIRRAESLGFVVDHALSSQTRFFTHLTRMQGDVASRVSVSYRKRHPMVEILHVYNDGSRENFQMVLLDKRAWRYINAYLVPGDLHPAPKKRKKFSRK